MTKEEIVEIFDLENGVIFFEPCDVFNKGIIGVTEDHKHLIYGYQSLVTALAESYEEEYFSKKENDSDENCMPDCEPDFYSDACEWIDYNRIRTIPCLDKEFAPIMCYELLGEKR